MVIEHATLDVRPGQEGQFELAFAQARSLISSMPGLISVDLARGLEEPSRYLLRVEWERLEDHTEGFRGSPEYQEWGRLLHHFYEPHPTVEHYTRVVEPR